MRFKLKNPCESNRDVTLLFDYNYDAMYTFWHYGNDGQFQEKHHIIKPLLKYKNEACWKLSLVTLASSYPKSNSKACVLRPVDTFFGESIVGTRSVSFNIDLKEYLRRFVEDDQPLRTRTLVIF